MSQNFVQKQTTEHKQLAVAPAELKQKITLPPLRPAAPPPDRSPVQRDFVAQPPRLTPQAILNAAVDKAPKGLLASLKEDEKKASV